MINGSKNWQPVSLVISLFALTVCLKSFQDLKNQPEDLCKSLGGTFNGATCKTPQVQTSGFELKDIGCPEGEYLAGITRDQAPVCKVLPVTVTTLPKDPQATEKKDAHFIGGWKMAGVCLFNMEGQAIGPCKVPTPNAVSKCESDLKPTYFAVGEVRATIPNPCLSREERCYVDDHEPGKEHKITRSFLMCDKYKINYFRIPSR